MTITIILNIIGIAIFYINRYEKRKSDTPWSFGFWLKENLPESLITLLFNIGLMLLLLHPETNVGGWLSSVLPTGLALAAKPTFAFLLGFGLAWVLYVNINNLIDQINKKIENWIKR